MKSITPSDIVVPTLAVLAVAILGYAYVRATSPTLEQRIDRRRVKRNPDDSDSEEKDQ